MFLFRMLYIRTSGKLQEPSRTRTDHLSIYTRMHIDLSLLPKYSSSVPSKRPVFTSTEPAKGKSKKEGGNWTPPEFDETLPSSVTVMEGETAILPCVVTKLRGRSVSPASLLLFFYCSHSMTSHS
ncbi:hypothetical protein E2C01_073585 [Portunus trituberculatus]|uniref:Uncharacterized protein n=1 Tax=Portunus trituberculatus TaxID=210409 RepID=A0A5B7I9U5_PORTR|nr:hypothetical protein [Portunus trituberculatus]